MVDTIKFSEFANGGDLSPNQTTVGLDNTNTINTRFTNAFPLLPPGSTGDRPTPAPSMYFRLRFNTTTELYEYYSPTATDWISVEANIDILPLLASHLPGEGASLIGLENQGTIVNKFVQDLANAALLSKTNNGTLVNGVYLNILPSGILCVSTGSGDLNARVLVGTINQIDILNGDGSADPVFSLSLTLNFPGTFTVQSSTDIDEIIDDDTLATATSTNLATALSIKTYVDNQISGIFQWIPVTGTSETMTPNRGYIADNVGLVTLTLPLASNVGDEIQVIGKGAGGWLVAQNAGQSIVFGTSTTTVGVGGSIGSTNVGDAFSIVCTTASLVWTVKGGPQGNLTVV